jgi:hypothetical protein
VSAILELLGKVADAVKAVPALRRNRNRKATLRRELEHPDFRWRSISRLARAIGASEQETRDLLNELGARGGTGKDGEEVWGLRSRVEGRDG